MPKPEERNDDGSTDYAAVLARVGDKVNLTVKAFGTPDPLDADDVFDWFDEQGYPISGGLAAAFHDWYHRNTDYQTWADTLAALGVYTPLAEHEARLNLNSVDTASWQNIRDKAEIQGYSIDDSLARRLRKRTTDRLRRQRIRDAKRLAASPQD